MMHVLMMSMYAAMAAIVLAAVDPKSDTTRQRVLHGLKIFGSFLGIGLLLSWVLFPIPW
ncbi:MAG TPA: hypothetical protein VE977_14545 [Pyrinomonadaceae bacterium]|jgi:hypothetical protein|nr:hypothetical protein [Pyrinomonadaceae bacterium]